MPSDIIGTAELLPDEDVVALSLVATEGETLGDAVLKRTLAELQAEGWVLDAELTPESPVANVLAVGSAS